MDDIRYQTARTADMNLLHPLVRPSFLLLMKDLTDAHAQGVTKTHFRPFETYRHPQRQREALRNRTSRADMYESAHNFGLAVDFVPWDNGRWSWDETKDWSYLWDRAKARGLIAIGEWDKAHIEHPMWQDWHACLRAI